MTPQGHHIRFGCGAALGCFLALLGAVGANAQSPLLILLVMFVTCATIGTLSMRYGDAFWEWAMKWMRFWWP
jgi:hypothetical protein